MELNCKRCKAELVRDKERNCWYCPVCHPDPNPKAPPVEEPKSKLIDVKFTEQQIREIVRDELENWHIHKPPVTRGEIEVAAAQLIANGEVISEIKEASENPNDWRRRARELGINQKHKTKEQILEEIKQKEQAGTSGLETSPEGDNN
jgi:hypothetical protein